MSTIPIDEYNQLADENKRLRIALRTIIVLGGNLSDEALESRTGANDAVRRGIMYTSSRQVAMKALLGEESHE